MIGLVTDSNAQLTAELGERHGVEVVPITVTVDGVDHLEGVDLDADGFYALVAEGDHDVSTTQPGPALFAAAYERVVAAGATEVLSVHVGSEFSGTLNSANVAASTAPVPVRLVDTHSGSFSIACCLLAATDAIAAGADLERAAAAAEAAASRLGGVVVIGTTDYVKASGRFDFEPPEPTEPLVMRGGAIESLGTGSTADELAALMADAMVAGGGAIRAGVGIGSQQTRPIADAMVERLDGHPAVAELITYRIGPSVAAHFGPNTAGGVWCPL